MSKKTESQSEMDILFESIFGFLPNKSGKSYELIVAAALKHVKATAQVQTDQYVTGIYSKTKFQLDAVVNSITAVEAKDYTEQQQKVGRPDITKLAGALLDLPQEKGIVASATGFTLPAIKYADASKSNPDAKEIELYHIRPSTELDEHGRIKTIVLNLKIYIADYEKSKWTPVFTKDGFDLLQTNFKKDEKLELKIGSFYRKDGSEIISVFELTSKIGMTDWERGISTGSWTSNEQAYIKVKSLLVPISKLEYEIPHNAVTQEIVIENNGKACLLIRSGDGSIDKLISDVDLKKTMFDDLGNVTITD